jgi:PAS domain S-box-containing protein
MPTSAVATERALARILIVEDEAVIAMDLQARLENLGYRVAGIAASAEFGYEKATRELPDLVLMDVRLEGDSDGIEAARRIRDSLFIPVIFITSFADDFTLDRARESEPLGYISKPFSDRDLHTSIRMALHRHMIEKRLREQRQWLDSVLRSIADAVVATGPEGRVRLLNPVAERLTGWTEAEALGRPFHEVVSLFDPGSHKPVDPLAPALRTGVPAADSGNRFILVSRNFTEIPIEDTPSAISSNGNGTRIAGGVFIFRDISERLRLERDIQQAWRMESLGRLAGGVAHDFNNLLTIILGLSALSPEDAARIPLPDLRRRFAAIESSATKAADLTARLLALGRRQLLHPKPLDANLLLRELIGVVRSVFPESVDLKLRTGAANSTVLADRAQLEQAILNIVLNARDAVGDSGAVLIGTGDSEIDGSPAVAIKVTDTGVGIPEDLKSRIFEPFFTTKDGSGGTGLGLASAYGIVSQSGGRIEVESTPGLGSTFIILLPVHADTAADSPELVAGPEKAGRTAHVILVEDNDLIRQLQSEILVCAGISVQSASNGTRALQLLNAAPEAIDLIVTDVVMPKMTGVALARLALELRPDIRILFVSGYASEQVSLTDFPPGATSFLRKPFTPAEFEAAIARLLARNGSSAA